MKSLVSTLAILLLAGHAAALPAIDDLDGLVAHALANHPALSASQSRSQAVAARIRGAGSLPDPVLRWGEMIESVETRVGPQRRVLSLQQTLPWPGTLGARSDAAVARHGAAGAGEHDVAVRVASGVRRAWARAAWLSETTAVAERQLALVRSLESSVRAGYEVGSGRYGDLLQVQLEVARLEDRLRGLEDEMVAATAGLNAALGRDPTASLEVPLHLVDPAPRDAEFDLTSHPQLSNLDHQVQAARHDADAARQAGRPQLTLGVDWIQVGEAHMDGVEDSGKDALVARLGVSLPIWRGKHDGARDAATARAQALAAERSARHQQLAARLTATDVARRDARRRRDLHANDLLPRARQAYEAVLAGYRADGTGFADVLSSQRTLLELEQGLLAARRDLLVAAADHDEATGTIPGHVPTFPSEPTANLSALK